jgi:hypothetical protein
MSILMSSRRARLSAFIPALVAAFLIAPATATSPTALASGDATNPSCPAATEASPGFREYLPDCRAYELVSPAFTYGEPVFVDGVSEAGGIAYHSLGSFGQPGDDSEETGGSYVGSRGASGWASVPVNPSASEFQGGDPIGEAGDKRETIDFSADLSESLFLQAPIGAKPVDSRFYRRRVSDGSYAEVGPLVPPEPLAAWTSQDANNNIFPEPRYLGASPDLDHIFFNLEIAYRDSGALVGVDWLWPGDRTGVPGVPAESLYEYTGTGNVEPELVGVENETSLAQAAHEQGKPHINEAAQLVSQCGVLLGGVLPGNNGPQEREEYNSLANSGESVFFTAIGHGDLSGCAAVHAPAFDEVYARVDRDRTVAISEPTTGPNGDCEKCDESEPATAVFQGASEDGSRVFFISEQKLLPGGDGENLYEYDFNGPEHDKVTLVASGLPPVFENTEGSHPEPGGVVRVTENGSLVYFVSTGVLAHNTDALGAQATAGADNLYVYDTGTRGTTFIARLAPSDGVSAPGSGGQNVLWSAEDARIAEATPDGRFLLFASVGDLTPDAAGQGSQLYRYEAPSEAHPAGVLIRVTTGEDGLSEDGNVAAVPQGVAISSDGSRVFFRSPLKLTAGALNDVCVLVLEGVCEAAAYNFYEWEGGHVYLLSDGQDTHAGLGTQELLGADASGDDVFFTSTDPLVPQAPGTATGIYDARVEGGFPAPAIPSECEGEACQAPSAPAPVFAPPGTATFSGPGNLASPPVPSPPKKVTKTKKASSCKSRKASRTSKKASRTCKSKARRARNDRRPAR